MIWEGKARRVVDTNSTDSTNREARVFATRANGFGATRARANLEVVEGICTPEASSDDGSSDRGNRNLLPKCMPPNIVLHKRQFPSLLDKRAHWANPPSIAVRGVTKPTPIPGRSFTNCAPPRCCPLSSV